MNLEERRHEISQMRRDFRAWLQRPDLTDAERQEYREALAGLDRLEHDIDDLVRLTRHAVEKFERPDFWKIVNGDEENRRQ